MDDVNVLGVADEMQLMSRYRSGVLIISVAVGEDAREGRMVRGDVQWSASLGTDEGVPRSPGMEKREKDDAGDVLISKSILL